MVGVFLPLFHWQVVYLAYLSPCGGLLGCICFYFFLPQGILSQPVWYHDERWGVFSPCVSRIWLARLPTDGDDDDDGGEGEQQTKGLLQSATGSCPTEASCRIGEMLHVMMPVRSDPSDAGYR
jgi:hypothetical protein